MAIPIGEGVTLEGLYDPKYNFTFKLPTGITAADVGKAVSQDTSADNQVKLAVAGEIVLGRLLVVEDRMQSEGVIVGTVNMKGFSRFNYAGTLPVRGQGVTGGTTAGYVQGSGSAPASGTHRVWSVDTTTTTCMVSHGI